MFKWYSDGGTTRLESFVELKVFIFQLFELVLLLKLDKQFHVEQFEATVSQSTVLENHLSNTTGLMHEFFKCGESCSKLL